MSAHKGLEQLSGIRRRTAQLRVQPLKVFDEQVGTLRVVHGVAVAPGNGAFGKTINDPRRFLVHAF